MRITTLLFDLDNTLYPPECGLLARVDERINAYISQQLCLSLPETRALRRRWVERYGTTLHGLRAEHTVDVEAFLAYAHDFVPLEEHLSIDEELLSVLPTIELERVIFTNGPRRWARRVLEFLRLASHFQEVCDLEFMEYRPKPLPEAYHRVLAHLGRRAEECVLADDTPRNLAAAKELGMATILVGPTPEPAPYADAVVRRPAEVARLVAEWREQRRDPTV